MPTPAPSPDQPTPAASPTPRVPGKKKKKKKGTHGSTVEFALMGVFASLGAAGLCYFAAAKKRESSDEAALPVLTKLKDKASTMAGSFSRSSGSHKSHSSPNTIPNSDDLDSPLINSTSCTQRTSERRLPPSHGRTSSTIEAMTQLEKLLGQQRTLQWYQISVATDKFAEANILGKGMSGNVYKATLRVPTIGPDADCYTASMRGLGNGAGTRPRLGTDGVDEEEVLAAVKVIQGEAAYGESSDPTGDDCTLILYTHTAHSYCTLILHTHTAHSYCTVINR
jgi:hypothetical protein